MRTVFCSGPAGLGVARSLREAFPDLRLVGVDDPARATGLHHPVFNGVRASRDGDGDLHARLGVGAQGSSGDGEVSSRTADGAEPSRDGDGAEAPRGDAALGDDAWWVPGCEREARRLSSAAAGSERLLSPSPAALARADDLPALADALGLRAPPAMAAQEDDWQLSAFGREHGWRLSLRGPDLDPAPVPGWRAVERLRAHLGDGWMAPGMRLQAHVDGVHEAIVFAAHRGTLLGARRMRAAIGAADAGRVEPVAGDLARRLERELEAAAWTGGGELELVRSVDGALWLVATRPCFPPWVHGATLAGANLPGALLAAATGRDPAPPAHRAAAFARVVVEVAVRDSVAIPDPVAVAATVLRAGTYLAGMPDRPAPPHPRGAPAPPDAALRAIVAALEHASATPHAHAIDPAPRWERLTAATRDAAGGARVEIAYSIKTDPSVELLRAAQARGFLAEAITEAEMRAAREAGFADGQIVLNGPAKRWPAEPTGAFAVFADSVEELAAGAEHVRSGTLATRYLGPRVRPPSIASRFGVPFDDFAAFRETVGTLRDLPQDQGVGMHFHWASSEAGHETWFQTVEATLDWGRRLQDLVGRPIACLDLGGGWQPDDFDAVFLPRLPDLLATCHAALDALDVIVLEPGRALVQPLAVVETTVLELRERDGARELVVDAALADVPRCVWYPHRLLHRDADGWRHWGRGPDRLVGRLCMEDDVLRTGIAVPDDVRPGTRVFIADAGAYDRSMAYSFGRG